MSSSSSDAQRFALKSDLCEDSACSAVGAINQADYRYATSYDKTTVSNKASYVTYKPNTSYITDCVISTNTADSQKWNKKPYAWDDSIDGVNKNTEVKVYCRHREFAKIIER